MAEKPKILIVDDDSEFLEEVKSVLTPCEYDIELLSDGTLALPMALKLKPEIILLDLKMGPKSGFQVADELRRAPELKDVSVIAITGYFTEKEHQMLMNICGIKKFLMKPLQPIHLISTIEFEFARRKMGNNNIERLSHDQSTWN